MPKFANTLLFRCCIDNFRYVTRQRKVHGCGTKNEINLFIDESGNLGTGMGRYFLICALEVDSSIKTSISKRAERIICRFKFELVD